MGYDETTDSNRNFFIAILVTTTVLTLPALAGRFGWLQSFVPLPIFYYLVAFGEQQGRKVIISAIVAAGIVALATGIMQHLIFSYMLLPVGFLLAHEAYNRESVTATAVKSVILLCLLWLIFGVLYATIKQSNPYTEALTAIDQDIVATYETLKEQYKDLPFDTKQELKSALERLRHLVPKIMPALIGIMILVTIWLNIIFGQLLLAKKKQAVPSWGRLRNWRLPDWLIWGAISAGLLTVQPFDKGQTIGLNLLLLFGTVYFFQGVAVFGSQLAKWSPPPLARIIIYVLMVLLQIYSILLLIILGVAEVWTNTRKVEKNNEVN